MLHPTSQEYLENGVWIDFSNTQCHSEGSIFAAGTRGELLGTAPLMPEVRKKHGYPQYVAHRADLHKALMDGIATLANVKFNVGCLVTNVDFVNRAISLQNGANHKADVIIGADGQYSWGSITIEY